MIGVVEEEVFFIDGSYYLYVDSGSLSNDKASINDNEQLFGGLRVK